MFAKLFNSKLGRTAMALIILNEIRGVVVVGAIVSAWLRA